MQPSSRRRILAHLIRICIAVGLTAYILWKSRPGDVLAAAAHADWRLVAVAVALTLVDRALMAYRWLELLCTIDPGARPPFTAVMRIFFVSTFVGTFLPASVGGDAVRAYSLAKWNVSGADAVASVFMDRMLGVASILLMALVGLFLAQELIGEWTIMMGLALATLACTVTLVLISSARVTGIASLLLAWLPDRLRRAGEGVLGSVRRYAAYPAQLWRVLGSSIGVQVLRIVQAYFLGRALGIDASLGVYFAFLPLILLVMLLPITFNGIGTSQLAFVWFFAHAGVPAPQAFALSVLFVALGIVGNLPGGLLYVFGGGGALPKPAGP